MECTWLGIDEGKHFDAVSQGEECSADCAALVGGRAKPIKFYL